MLLLSLTCLQARVSDMTAAGCMQAFPTYPTMSTLTEELVHTDASISYDQAEPLHADTSSVLQVSGWPSGHRCMLLSLL